MCLHDAFANSDTCFTRWSFQLGIRYARYIDMDVDTIQERTQDLAAVSFNLINVAMASPGGITQVAAGTPLRCLFAI